MDRIPYECIMAANEGMPNRMPVWCEVNSQLSPPIYPAVSPGEVSEQSLNKHSSRKALVLASTFFSGLSSLVKHFSLMEWQDMVKQSPNVSLMHRKPTGLGTQKTLQLSSQSNMEHQFLLTWGKHVHLRNMSWFQVKGPRVLTTQFLHPERTKALCSLALGKLFHSLWSAFLLF